MSARTRHLDRPESGSACGDATHAAEPTAIGEHRSAGPTSGLAKSLLVVLAMRDELLAELIGWLERWCSELLHGTLCRESQPV